MRFALEGILPAIITPFTRGGARVDYEKACAFADRLVEQGVHGIFVSGTTGEGLLMTAEERKRLAAELVKAVGKRIRVIVQTGCLDTATTTELTRAAREAGAYAAGVYAPGFYAYDDTAMIRHFTAVAKSAPDMPLLLYNIPRCTGNALSPELIIRLADRVDNIVGIKDSSADMIHFSRVVNSAPRGFTVINGADEYSLQAYMTGARGSVSITANVVPEIFLSIYSNHGRGSLNHARASQAQLARVMEILGYGRLVAAYKEAIRLRGFDAGYVRPPQRELTKSEKRAIAKGLEREGLI